MLSKTILVPLFFATFSQASVLRPRQSAEKAIMYEYGHDPSTTTSIDYGDDPAAAWLAAHPEIEKPSTYDWQAAQSTDLDVAPTVDATSADYQSAPTVVSAPGESSIPPVPTSSDVPTASSLASPPTSSVAAVESSVASPPSPPGSSVSVSAAPTSSVGYGQPPPPVSSTAIVSAPEGTNGARPTVTGEEHTDAPPQATDGCSCGYTLTDYDNRYYPEKTVLHFSTVPDGADLTQYGFYVNDGDSAGPASTTEPGRRCVGSAENVYVQGGVLHLKVPAGQAGSTSPTGAELIFNPDVTGGLFVMEAQVDATPGTCMSIHTYTKVAGTSDEIDIEVLGQTIFEDLPPNFKGMGLSNYEPGGSKAGNHSEFPNDPTQGFNRYGIGWFNDGPRFFYNDAPTAKQPEIKIPTNKCSIIINNWTNGDPTFTQGPPATDSILKVRKIEYYYSVGETTVYPALKDSCTVESACPVSGGAAVVSASR
ncbi:hypothetical protein I317_04855 [Kwoniella heveanensis CBS 569]|nr:hypothetical protein I317_04855 [Kwoniella heveanensis CBS 569]